MLRMGRGWRERDRPDTVDEGRTTGTSSVSMAFIVGTASCKIYSNFEIREAARPEWEIAITNAFPPDFFKKIQL